MFVKSKNLNLQPNKSSATTELQSRSIPVSDTARSFGSLPKYLAVPTALKRAVSSVVQGSVKALQKINDSLNNLQPDFLRTREISKNFASLSNPSAVRLWAAAAGLFLATEKANAWVVNSLDVADIQNQGGATVLQSGTFNLGQYGIVIPAGLVPQEIAIVVSGNAVGGSFDVSQHNYGLQINSATLSSYNSGPIYSLDMGPALRQDGTVAGTLTTPEGWVVYDSSTYHSESGQSANAYDDNHLLYFRIDALNPTSQNFNSAAYNFFATSSVTRLISVQSMSYTTAGVPQLGNDANAPVSVYRDSATSAFVAGPRPLGAAMDAGEMGQLIDSSSVPEPSTAGLLTVAGIMGFLARRHIKKSLSN